MGAGGGRRGGGGTTKCTPIYEYSIAIPSLIRWPVSQYLGMTEGWYCQYMGTTHIKKITVADSYRCLTTLIPPIPFPKMGCSPLRLDSVAKRYYQHKRPKKVHSSLPDLTVSPPVPGEGRGRYCQYKGVTGYYSSLFCKCENAIPSTGG